jgi:hypothetical protein
VTQPDKPTIEEAMIHFGAKSPVALKEAVSIIKQNIIDSSINAVIQWENNWLFSVYTSDPDEGELDPFYAVNMETGAFSGFSIVGDQDTSGILQAFSAVIEHGDTSSGFLAHYGKKGMRWGVTNDPKSGPSNSSKNLESGLNAIKPLLGPVIPRAAIIPKLINLGAAIANGSTMKVALTSSVYSPLAFAGYAVTGLDSGAYRVPVVATKNLARGGWIKDKSLANPKMSVADIQKKVVSPINKDYPGLGTTNNCLRATYTYEMRRRGNDVAATKTMLASGQTALGPKLMTQSIHSNTKIKNINNPTGIKGLLFGKPPTAQQTFNILAKQPDRSRGDLQMSWGPMMGGHSVAYEIVNKKPVIFDTQSGKTYSTASELNMMTRYSRGMSFNRLDNKNLNETAMTAWVKDA